MKIEFLGMDGCHNMSEMWESLLSAMKELQWNQLVDKLNLIALSEKLDKPTILVDGKDLFDSSFPETYNPSCRYYPNGLPGTKEIAVKLKSVTQ
jgi:hypothetical protein